MLKSEVYKLTEAFLCAKNPRIDIIKASNEWIKKFDEISITNFNDGKFESLAAWKYPFAQDEKFRATCDFMNWLFLLDDILEVDKNSELIAENVVRAIRDEKFDDGSKIVQATKEIFSLVKSFSSVKNYDRFVDCTIKGIFEAKREFKNRQNGQLLDLDSYIKSKRYGSASFACIELNAIILDTNFSDEFYKDPVFKETRDAMIDVDCIFNDMISYKVEKEKKLSDCNLITVLMNEKQISFQESCKEALKMGQELINSYYKHRKMLDLDEKGKAFIDCFEYHISGSVMWYKETSRYGSGTTIG